NEPHGKSAHFMVGGSAAVCDTCHGPGEKHNETTLKQDILNPPSMAPDAVNKMCLVCHSKEHARLSFAASEHDRKGMSCFTCHSTHHAKSRSKELMKATQGELCTGCHAEIRKAYYQRSTHLFRTEWKNEEIQCSNCHNPHGGERKRMLVGVATND